MAVFEVFRGIEFGRHERNAGGTVGFGRSPHGAALPPVATMPIRTVIRKRKYEVGLDISLCLLYFCSE